jgi:hypothetical protein
MTKHMLLSALVAVSLGSIAVQAQQPLVPFKARWTGVTVAADLTTFPVVGVLSVGEGNATHLGQYTMESPHTSNVFTGETIGEQIFTAANGDTLTAHCEGFPVPQPSGTVEGSLDCSITSGTGRFVNAVGGYEFYLVAVPKPDVFPPIYETEAKITGQISFQP